MDNLNNNAISSAQGFVYQNLVALEKCFELLQDKILRIETFGDVTIENLVQVEVKNVKTNLTDLNVNFWKTLKNWMDDKFDTGSYESLILYTTQKIGPKSNLLTFNEKGIDGKLTIINGIANEFFSKSGDKSAEIQKYMDYILNSSRRDKLRSILGKFTIISGADDYSEIYHRLCGTWASHLPTQKHEQYLNNLIGFIANKVASNFGEITYKDFKAEKQKISQYLTPNTIVFPKTFACYIPSKDEENRASSYSFIKKIHDIEYYEDVGIDAITNFYQARKTIHEEISNYEDVEYLSYENELKKLFTGKYRRFCRKASQEDFIEISKDFYDEVIEDEPPVFHGFISTPRFFRNGWLHIIVDENEEISWKLKAK